MAANSISIMFKKNKKSITLLITIFILSLSTIIIMESNCPTVIRHYKVDRIKYNHFRLFENLLELYYKDHHQYPSSAENLSLFVHLGYIEKTPIDPWGNHYIYSPEKAPGTKYTLYSRGKNGIDENGSGDDFVNWDKDYPCGMYYPCWNWFSCESIKYYAVGIGVLSLTILTLLTAYLLLRGIINRFK